MEFWRYQNARYNDNNLKKKNATIFIYLLFIVFFLLGDTPAFAFYVPTFRNNLCSISICGVSLHGLWRRTECSEASAHKIQTLQNHPKEIIQHSEHGDSLNSRVFIMYLIIYLFIYSPVFFRSRCRVCSVFYSQPLMAPRRGVYEPVVLCVMYTLSNKNPAAEIF